MWQCVKSKDHVPATVIVPKYANWDDQTFMNRFSWEMILVMLGFHSQNNSLSFSLSSFIELLSHYCPLFFQL